MTIHLKKLSVGPQRLSDLTDRQTQHVAEMKAQGLPPELMHITRHMPKRAGELLEGGSIFWIIKGWICARQKLIELRPVVKNDALHCGIIYDLPMIRIHPRPHRPFQGWRYLDPKDAPRDLTEGETSFDDIPDNMRQELVVLGLI